MITNSTTVAYYLQKCTDINVFQVKHTTQLWANTS